MQDFPADYEVYSIFQRVLWFCFLSFFIIPAVLYPVMLVAARVPPTAAVVVLIYDILQLYLFPVYQIFGSRLFTAPPGLAPKGTAGFIAVLGFYTVVSFLLAGLAQGISVWAKKRKAQTRKHGSD